MLEKARGERFIGSALEAKVLLHVADAELAQSLQGLQGVCPNFHYRQAFQARHICEKRRPGLGQGVLHDTVDMVVSLACNLCTFPFRATS